MTYDERVAANHHRRVWKPEAEAPPVAWALYRMMRRAEASGARFFLGAPDDWLAARLVRCPKGHVSRAVLKTERGSRCLGCGEVVYLTHPDDSDGELKPWAGDPGDAGFEFEHEYQAGDNGCVVCGEGFCHYVHHTACDPGNCSFCDCADLAGDNDGGDDD